MKNLVFKIVASVLTSYLFFAHNSYALYSILGPINPHCSIGDQPLTFTIIDKAMFKATASIDHKTYLLYTYNIYYSIGGKVSFISQEKQNHLLIWDNGFTANVTSGSVEYKGLSIKCHL